MDIKKITSVKNQIVKDLIKLKKDSQDCFLIEGYKMVKTAVDANSIKTLFFVDKYLDEFAQTNFEKYLINNDVADKLAETKTNQGIFALCLKKEAAIDFNNNVLILDTIQDPGNLGTLIRCAKAFNFQTILCSPNCVSFYNQKVIRSSQSYLFDLNLITDELIKNLKILKENNYLIVGSQCGLENTFDVQTISNQKIALILGNEGNGISKDLEQYFDQNFLINLANNVDSLNVAIAGGIMMNKIYNGGKNV